MRLVYLILCVASVVLAVIAYCLFGAYIVMSHLQDYAGLPPPLFRVGGVIVSADAVFVGSWYGGRIYKFDFAGKLLKEIDVHGEPIWITQNGERVVVHYSGREWALDDPDFRVRDPGGVRATVERTWWGHPMLVVRHADGATSHAELQPWHVTVLRNLYPAGLSLPIAFAFTLAAIWLRRRLRN